MRTPEFWQHSGGTSTLLTPAGFIYAMAGRLLRRRHTPWRSPIPVICIGNVVVGGAGKTLLALSIGARLRERGHNVHFLTRGYGGSLKGPVRVNNDYHGAKEVGDEPLLLADVAPTWVSRNRAASAKAAIDEGADVLIMDDGLQNLTLAKNISILAIDGGYGFGNEKIIPAGPLREPIADALKRVDKIVIVGKDRFRVEEKLPTNKAILNATLVVPTEVASNFNGRRVVAFAGIARPAKFFQTLKELNCEVVMTFEFADHHLYSPDKIMKIVEEANKLNATPVTTSKDAARLPPRARLMVEVLPVEVAWQNEAELNLMLDRALTH